MSDKFEYDTKAGQPADDERMVGFVVDIDSVGKVVTVCRSVSGADSFEQQLTQALTYSSGGPVEIDGTSYARRTIRSYRRVAQAEADKLRVQRQAADQEWHL